jgi:hypothetical protein
MSAKRDSYGLAAADPDGNPKVIDVARDSVDFRDESDRDAGHVDKLPMIQLKVALLPALAVSMWQSDRFRSLNAR